MIADSEAMPKTSRRSLLAAFSLLPIATCAAPAFAGGGDAELVAIGKRYAELMVLADEGDGVWQELENYALLHRPQKPEALRVQKGDYGIGWPLPEFHDYSSVEYYREQLPKWEAGHLQLCMPDPATIIARGYEVVAADVEWRLAITRVQDACGLTAIYHQQEDICDRKQALIERAEVLPATSLAGLHAKAIIASDWMMTGKPHELDMEDRTAQSIIHDLLALTVRS